MRAEIFTDTVAAKNVLRLISYASDYLYLQKADRVYAENQLLDLLGLSQPCDEAAEEDCYDVYSYLGELSEYAVSKGLCDEMGRARFETKIMGILTPAPSKIIEMYNEITRFDGTEEACRFLNYVSEASTYIRLPDIAKNISWEHQGPLGNIVITINRSKPEKTPEEVRRAKEAKTGYPKCPLCAENVGFSGSDAKPARQTLRTIPVELDGEEWFIQFSPFVYFEQHMIAVSREHRPMAVNAGAFRRMLDFVKSYPHYFIGSNAALPIVGGSILAHDHYQGGKKVLPVFARPARRRLLAREFPDVDFAIADWYNSVIRLTSKNTKQLAAAAEKIRAAWENWTDESVNLIAHSKQDGITVPHNAITPVCSVNSDLECQFDLILRNNRTDAAHPYGIFHPAEELHNIKQEAIGIIEVMGLFILPGRLKEECDAIRDILTGETALDFRSLAEESDPLHRHFGMIAQLVADNGTSMKPDKADAAIKGYIERACERILETTAVFKNDEQGQSAFDRFLNSVL